MKNLISIVVPCYNIENYIEKTIKSVLNSTYTHIELILINDGSTDNTLKILKKNEKKDHRIKVIDKKNSGVSSARNIGIKASNGNYIYFLDGDDTIENNMFEDALKIFKENSDIDIFSFGFDIVSENDIQLKNYNFKKYDKKIFSREEFLNLFFTKKLRQHICSFVVKKEILIINNITFAEDVNYGEDLEVQIKLLLSSNLIYYDKKCYFHYLKRSSSAINLGIINYDSLIILRRLKPDFEKKTISTKLRQNFYNFTSLFFILKWKAGILKRYPKNYFNELNTFSELLGNTTLTFNVYDIIAFLFSKFYLTYRKNK